MFQLLIICLNTKRNYVTVDLMKNMRTQNTVHVLS